MSNDGRSRRSPRNGVGALRFAPERGEFWLRPPTRSRNAVDLYRHGLASLADGDGLGAIRTGWTLWTLHGLHRFDCRDFVTDGYDLWHPTVGPTESLRFVRAAFARACEVRPVLLPDDFSELPSDRVLPTAAIYGLRCWSGLRIIHLCEQLGDDIGHRRAQRELRTALTYCHPALLTPETRAYFGHADPGQAGAPTRAGNERDW